MKGFYLTLCFVAISICSFAEGTLQLITCPTCQAGISINDKAQFAHPGLTEERRLHIRIGDFATEEIYVALGQTEKGGDWYSRLVSPSGVVYTYDGTTYVAGGTGATLPIAITTATENSAGPNGVTQDGAAAATTGSYNSTTFVPNENGDWYIEFTDDAAFGIPTVSARSPYWDISVVDVSTAANDVINGRLWSEQWGLRSGSGAQTDPGDFLASTFYVYTEPEQVVTAIEIGDENDPGWGGDWLIACNRYGIDAAAYAAGDATTARQSYNGDAAADYGLLSEYKIFVNDPDIEEFPSGIEDVSIDGISIDICDDGSTSISFATNAEGVGDIIMDFPPYNNDGTEDITLATTVINAGANSFDWDGLDGTGNPVAPGTTFLVRLFIGASTVHFPMFDIEGVTGMKARLVRPGTPGYIGLYWDNSQVPVDDPTNPLIEANNPGCISSPTVACNAYGNSNNMTLNMWWNGLETNVEDQVLVPQSQEASIIVNSPQFLCINDNIAIQLSSEVGGVDVVEWTSSSTGTFNNNSFTDATYFPSLDDINAGTITLTLSSSACSNVQDQVTVDIPDAICFLPIRLSDFSATFINTKDHCEGVKLTWKTETEENTDHYILESSANGTNFELVGRVDAVGNSLSTQIYTFTDTDINSVNYYKLTVYDFDGTSESFLMNNTVQTDCFGDIAPNTISELYPNPVRNNEMISLKLHIANAANAMIQIKDMHGRTVSTIPTNLNEGESIVNFNLDGIGAGIYFVNIATENWTTDFTKLVKIQ